MQPERKLNATLSGLVGPRLIARRMQCVKKGQFMRIVDPKINGEALKPFVALTHFAIGAEEPQVFSLHPHSGIATLTSIIDGELAYEDSTGRSGVLPAGSLEWLCAGSGVWHLEHTRAGKAAQGFQLWLALPPALEHMRPESQYVSPEEVVVDGPARIILGQYGTKQSAVRAPQSLTLLDVHLSDGELWDYEPDMEHTVAWVFPLEGELRTPEAIAAGELAIFEESNLPVTFSARGETHFIVGSAIKHQQDLVLGYYCIHTSNAALVRGRSEIERTGKVLLEAGKLDAAQLQKHMERIYIDNW